MKTRSVDENSVCLSVCQTHGLWQNERKKCVDIFIPYERSFSLVFWEEKWLVGATPFYLKFWVNRPPRIADFEPIFARSASAVTPSEKSSINTNRKSTTRLPMSVRWSSYVAPKSPKGGSKISLRLKKVCYKVSLCENCPRQRYKAFIGLTTCAKTIGLGRPLVPEMLGQNACWIKLTALERNRRFSIYFRFVVYLSFCLISLLLFFILLRAGSCLCFMGQVARVK